MLLFLVIAPLAVVLSIMLLMYFAEGGQWEPSVVMLLSLGSFFFFGASLYIFTMLFGYLGPLSGILGQIDLFNSNFQADVIKTSLFASLLYGIQFSTFLFTVNRSNNSNEHRPLTNSDKLTLLLSTLGFVLVSHPLLVLSLLEPHDYQRFPYREMSGEGFGIVGLAVLAPGGMMIGYLVGQRISSRIKRS